jgi:hypothetical protein
MLVWNAMPSITAMLREAAHLGGDHGEAASLLARARGFHRGVERQDVGLERDAVDHGDDLGDALGRLRHFLHGRDDLVHHLAALLRVGGGGAGELARVPRVLRVLAHGGREFLERRGGFLERARVLLGAAGQLLVAGGDLVCAHGDGLRTRADLRHHPREAVVHVAQRAQQVGRLVAPGGLDAGGEVPRGHALGHGDGILDGNGDAARRRPRDQDREHEHHERHGVGDGGHAVAAHHRRLHGLVGRLLLQVDEAPQVRERLLHQRIDFLHEDLRGRLVLEARGQAQRLREGLVQRVVALGEGLEQLALGGGGGELRHALARLVGLLAQRARAVLVDLHRLDVAVQADVAHHRRLLQRVGAHLGGERLLHVRRGHHAGEVVAALLAEPRAAERHRDQYRQHRAEA